jgi:hypothetical protein
MRAREEPPLSIDELDIDLLRSRSKALFGNMDRLVVAAAVAGSPDGVVNATDLSWQLRLANNRVRAQLLAFAEVGLLRAPPDTDGRKRWFVRIDDPFWDACRDLVLRWGKQ